MEEERIPHIIASPFPIKPQGPRDTNASPSAELKIKNTSNTITLEEVSVRISECSMVHERQEEPGVYYLGDYPMPGWKPTNIYWSERNAPPKQLNLPIPPGATKIASVAFRREHNRMVGIFNTPTHPMFLDRVKVVIEISSRNSAIWKEKYCLTYRPAGKDEFEFLEWAKWEDTHKVISSSTSHKEGYQT